MASNLIVVLAASGLLATGVDATTQTRSADAIPAAKISLVQAAPTKSVGAACFMPVSTGKVAKLSSLRKARAAGQCVDAQETKEGKKSTPAAGFAPGFSPVGVVLPVVAATVASVAVSCSVGSGSKC
jgi:hypothetical protein